MAARPRIVSLLPSATEIAAALGFEEEVVGRSHECDWPPAILDRPVLTRTKLEKGLGSAEIEDRVQAIVRQGLSVYEVDAARLRSLAPDVILTQSQCAVCAVTPADLEEALGAWVGTPPQLVSLAPDDLGDVWGDVRRVGAALGAEHAAEALVVQLEARLAALRARTATRAHRPTVAAVEWIEPLMAAGNWVPELIEIAGGQSLFARAGEHSPWLEWARMAEAEPDIVVLMPCGYRIEDTLREAAALADHPEWSRLGAVARGDVFAADGHHFFNRPGPRLVESAGILAAIIDAWEAGDGRAGEGWRTLSEAVAA